MPGGLPQPFRGQARPKFPRPRKQIRNLKLENREKIAVIGIGLLVTSLATGIVVYMSDGNINIATLAVIVIITLFCSFITVAIFDGMRSINKFRKGYDIDVSGEIKNDDRDEKDSQGSGDE